MSGLTRRELLLVTAAGVGTAALAPATAAAAAPAAARVLVRVEGSAASVSLVPGPATTVLLHVARRFSYEVAALGPRDAASADGTSLELLPLRLPAGSAGNLFPVELLVVRDVLGECGGLVAWGGDDAEVPREGAFRLTVAPGDPRLARLADRLVGSGTAGTQVDALDPVRRLAAVSVQQQATTR